MKNFIKLSFVLTLIAFFSTIPVPLQAVEKTSQEKFSSVEERRLQSLIVQERENIEKERKEISMRKKELKTLEEGVDKKLAEIENKLVELETLQKKIELLLAAKSTEEKRRQKDLAKIYEKMSPVRAALSLSGLDPQLAADLIANMKVKAAAKILDQFSKQQATQLSTTFSTLQLE